MKLEFIRKLNSLLTKKERRGTLGLFLLILFGSMAELLGVSVLFPIVDLAMSKQAEQSTVFQLLSGFTGVKSRVGILLILIGGAVGLYVIKSVYLSWMNMRLYHFAAVTKRRMATSLMEAYLSEPYAFFLNRPSSELIRSINVDTYQLYEVLLNILLIASNAVTAALLILNLAVTNFLMTMTIAAFLGITELVILLFVAGRTTSYSRKNQQMQSYLLRYLQQAIEGIKEIKILQGEHFYIRKYAEAYTEQTEVEKKFRLLNLIPKYIIEAVCLSGILLYLGANIIWNEDYLSILPQLAVFGMSAFKLLPCVNAAFTYLNTIMFHQASVDLVYRDMQSAKRRGYEISSEINDVRPEAFPFREKIELKNVRFRYETGPVDILESGSFLEIKKGSSVGLIGASGGGKTTTADLILGLLFPLEGKVLADGRDIQENLSGWQANFGYIPQTIFLTDDSILHNVAMGLEEERIDRERVLKALDKAMLREFVESLPKGIDTEIGEHGMRISGGQRQRIGIARALYRDPDILVFDEATSALDNETEKEVMEAVVGLKGVKTMIIIAHRLSTIEHCDHVYKIEKGRVERIR